MDIITVLLSLITLIVFFVMANNIGTLVSLTRTVKEQNFKIIELLKSIAPPEKLSTEDKAKLYDQLSKK